MHATPRHAGPTRASRFSMALSLLFVACLALAARLSDRWDQARASGDRGSETVEKAVIAAILLAAALGLTAAITGVIGDYKGRIQSPSQP
jgi:MFS family permease